MKNNLLRTFFEWALITSVLMSVGFFLWYFIKSHEVRSCRVRIVTAQAGIQSNHTIMTVLLNESREYGKTNAEMARLLDSLMSAPAATPAPAAAATSAPTNKPRAK